MALDNRDLNLILAGLFELRITCLESDVACAQLEELAEKLHGDRKAMFYGATAPDRFVDDRNHIGVVHVPSQGGS
jgi:hypothetical protein